MYKEINSARTSIMEKLMNRAGEITYLTAYLNYTILYFNDGGKYVSSQTLKRFEELLTQYPNFSRIHRRHIINKNCMSSHIGSEVILDCGRVLPVARRRVV